MPSLSFANLGTTPGNHRVAVAGELYLLRTEDSQTVLVLDTRTYITKPPERYRVRFKPMGSVEVAVMPPSILKASIAAYKAFKRPFGTTLEEISDVYVVNLSGQAPATVGWRRLHWLFPNAKISNIPVGKTNWRAITEEEPNRHAIRDIEATGLVARGERVEVGPFKLFFFRNKDVGGGSSVLVSGDSNGQPFTLLLAEKKLHEYFPFDLIDTGPVKLRTLSAGRWHAFYNASVRTPVKELTEQT